MTADELCLTVEDANRRLPLVRAIVRDAMRLKTDVLARQDRLLELRQRYPDDEDEGSPYAEEVLQMEESLEDDEIRIDEFAAELRQVGAELIDSEIGLVEFASAVDRERIHLSWMYDEPELAFWRSGNETPADRKPLLLTGQQTS